MVGNFSSRVRPFKFTFIYLLLTPLSSVLISILTEVANTTIFLMGLLSFNLIKLLSMLHRMFLVVELLKRSIKTCDFNAINKNKLKWLYKNIFSLRSDTYCFRIYFPTRVATHIFISHLFSFYWAIKFKQHLWTCLRRSPFKMTQNEIEFKYMRGLNYFLGAQFLLNFTVEGSLFGALSMKYLAVTG